MAVFSGCRLDIRLVQPLNFLHRPKVGGHPSRDRRLAINPAAGGVLVEPGLAAKVGLFPAQRRKGLRELFRGHLVGHAFSLVNCCEVNTIPLNYTYLCFLYS